MTGRPRATDEASGTRSSRRSAGSSPTRSSRSPPTSSATTASRPTSSTRCASSACSASPSPRPTAASASTCLTYIGVIEELAYGWMSLTGIVNTHTMAATLLLAHGDRGAEAALAARPWRPGERRGALSLSEPDAGSDTRNISCRAAARRRRVRVNGTKAWVTNGERAGDRGPGGPHRGGHLRLHRREGARARRSRASRSASTSASSATGASRRSRWPTSTTGSRPPTSIGEAGRGLPQILGVLEVGRINIAARAVGVARAAFDAALAYAQQRETFGKPIGEHQAIQLKLADMATRLEAARLLTRNAAERKAAGLRCDVEAGMAKLFASETALELATEAMRIHGGVGYTTDLPVERLLPGRPADGDRRGDQRDPAAGHRPGPAGPGPRPSSTGRAPSASVGQLGQHLARCARPSARRRRRGGRRPTSEKRRPGR